MTGVFQHLWPALYTAKEYKSKGTIPISCSCFALQANPVQHTALVANESQPLELIGGRRPKTASGYRHGDAEFFK